MRSWLSIRPAPIREGFCIDRPPATNSFVSSAIISLLQKHPRSPFASGKLSGAPFSHWVKILMWVRDILPAIREFKIFDLGRLLDLKPFGLLHSRRGCPPHYSYPARQTRREANPSKRMSKPASDWRRCTERRLASLENHLCNAVDKMGSKPETLFELKGFQTKGTVWLAPDGLGTGFSVLG